MRIATTAAWTVLACGVLACAAHVQAQPPAKWMLELTLQGRKIEGTPLAWSTRAVHLMGRDGQLWEFPPSQAADYRKTSDRFQSYSISELRALLLRDLGEGFEVSGTGHYLVAHPQGRRDQWAQRFEDLYRSFAHYFSVRGFKLAEPPFPLIGVVCRNRQEFARYSAHQGGPTAPGILGYYSLSSNRILLYDVGAGDASSAGWQQNAATVIHEATHQTAFNRGIHSRYAAPPVWVAEGLATMFEAPGVYDSRSFTRRADRINPGRFRQFKELVLPRHRPELLAGLVASDRLFQSSPAAAYAEAWALTFYLVETQPRKYADYLARTANRPAFEPGTAAERTADFAAVFGDDWRMAEARFVRFMKEVE
jgi:hypothetical protein